MNTVTIDSHFKNFQTFLAELPKFQHILAGFHAIRNRIKLDSSSIKIVLVDKERRDPRMRDLILLCKHANIAVMQTDKSHLSHISKSIRHQGVIALVNTIQKLLTIHEVITQCNQLQVPPFLLILDGITDPRNLGACLRVADGAGVHAVIAAKDRSAPLNDIAKHTSAGANEHIPYILVTNLARSLDELVEAGITVIGLADQADHSLYESNLNGALAIVMGSEGDGLRRLTRERCDTMMNIPMLGSVESLNVSVATGVVLYEAVRQRTLLNK